VKQRSGNVSDGGSKGRVEKSKSPRGKGFKAGSGRGRGRPAGRWMGPK
jgi:ribosomal RNA-processing protein 12